METLKPKPHFARQEAENIEYERTGGRVVTRHELTQCGNDTPLCNYVWRFTRNINLLLFLCTVSLLLCSELHNRRHIDNTLELYRITLKLRSRVLSGRQRTIVPEKLSALGVLSGLIGPC